VSLASSANDALIAAVLIGGPLALAGVLGLGWLDDWRHRRHRDREERRERARRRTGVRT
jgi:hypothetical protein